MSRIELVTPEKAKGDVNKIYNSIQKGTGGMIPNIFQAMGNSAAVLNGFFSLSDAVNKTSLSSDLRSMIALAVGQANECHYCISAHSIIAHQMGLSARQIINARIGQAQDPKDQAILKFAQSVATKRGKVSEEEVNELKAAGVTDTELVEIIMAIMLNTFTNYFNLIVDTKLDFPHAPRISNT